VFATVNKQLGGDYGNITTNITNATSTLRPPDSKAGFKVIMDQKKTSVLASGKDGYIYLVETTQNYDLSSPWGTVDLKSDTVNLDVFGRIMSSITKGSASEVRVYSPNKVPSKERAA